MAISLSVILLSNGVTEVQLAGLSLADRRYAGTKSPRNNSICAIRSSLVPDPEGSKK